MYDPEKDPPKIRKETKPHQSSRKVDPETIKWLGKTALRGK